ncbi:sugar transferase [Cohnella sp. REN36]|uniref:sugar transferase n=1 Tax=Cohnella sp. REN36 TaxID=2887347 RepID=UPI001D136DFB|nr:sugar transferase [Cohnella sp. REN36]MCC3375999.1 sugar transferase [Cohnella sp. REN36]
MGQNHAVIFFIYNRPDHTAKVLEGLKKNRITKMYVFSDGPRAEKDVPLVEETRNLIRNIDWCEVEAEYSPSNKGLANSVIYGVTKVFQKGYESVIVLEDDCVPSDNYIHFMKSTLDYYKNVPHVMHVSGFGLPIKRYTKADVYFTPFPCSWGWGTWANDWLSCNFDDIDNYERLLTKKDELYDFNYCGEGMSSMLQMQLDKRVNSWLIRWYYHIYNRNGRCVWSYESMIDNKGFDGTGAHKMKFDRFNQRNKQQVTGKQNFQMENDLNYHPALIREFRRYFIGKSFKERLKTVIYLTTGVILEPKRTYKFQSGLKA